MDARPVRHDAGGTPRSPDRRQQRFAISAARRRPTKRGARRYALFKGRDSAGFRNEKNDGGKEKEEEEEEKRHRHQDRRHVRERGSCGEEMEEVKKVSCGNSCLCRLFYLLFTLYI